ncbi:MAG TPA: response regulator transcription factor [Anaerolineales bacterium]|nr:response regulator transcription factor [Anaerolineales bacterium]
MTAELILIVEDEPSIAEVVGLYLRRSGYRVIFASDGLEAQNKIESQSPDLVVMDLMLPIIDGFELTRWLRNRSNTPIIMLTARRDEVDRIAGLEMGADDYIIKPFSSQEVVSRVRAVLRRTNPQPDETTEKPLNFPSMVIDPQTRLVTIDGEEITLTAKEFDTLWLLAQHPRQVFIRNHVLERVWGISDYIDPSTVTVHIRRIREKIEPDPSTPQHLLTVWGVGYKFEP